MERDNWKQQGKSPHLNSSKKLCSPWQVTVGTSARLSVDTAMACSSSRKGQMAEGGHIQANMCVCLLVCVHYACMCVSGHLLGSLSQLLFHLAPLSKEWHADLRNGSSRWRIPQPPPTDSCGLLLMKGDEHQPHCSSLSIQTLQMLNLCTLNPFSALCLIPIYLCNCDKWQTGQRQLGSIHFQLTKLKM